MTNIPEQKKEKQWCHTAWKHRDRYVEDYMAKNYDYVYNSTFFATDMYNDFAKEVKTKIDQDKIDQNTKNSNKNNDKKKILEIGCGTAIIANILSTEDNINSKDNFEIFCLDYSFNMIQIAKKRCPYFIQSDIESLPFQSSIFDIVYVHSALHHFPLLSKIMNEVKRILKPGGIFIIQEPCICNLKDSILRYIRFFCRKFHIKRYNDLSYLELIPSDHHGPISAEKLVSVMERSGFSMEEKKYKYYASKALSEFNNYLVHFIGRMLDNYYIKKYNDGYLFFVVGKNNE